MDGEEQRRHHNDEDGRREEDGHLVPSEHVAVAGSRLFEQAFGDKDAVIHTHAENEGGNDDVDEVEFQADESHVTLHHEPTEHHREEGQQGSDEVAERNQQDDQDEQRRNPNGDIEVIVDDLHHALAVVERLQDESLGVEHQCIGYDVLFIESH